MNSKFKAGAARERFDIPPGFYPYDGFTEQWDDLHARSLIIENGKTSAAFISLELTSLLKDDADEIRRRVREEFGYHIVWVSASHSFQSPHLNGPGREMSPEEKRKSDQYRELVLKAVFTSVTRARENLTGARMGVSKGLCDVNINRDVQTAEGWWKGADPEGPSDKELYVLYWETLEGSPLACLINYPVQSNILLDSRTRAGEVKASSDLAGYVSRYVEKAWGDKAVALWHTGASGDQDPIFIANRHCLDPEGRYSRSDLQDEGYLLVELLGERLGRAVLSGTDSIEKFSESGQIRSAEKNVTLPGQKIFPDVHRMKPVKEYRFEASAPLILEIHMILINSTALIGMAPEIVCSTALEIREAFPFTDILIMTMVNGAAKYLPDRQSYRQICYAAMNSRGAMGAAEIYRDEIIGMLKELETPEKETPMVIDANMYWMPDTLFKDSRLLERFIESVPRGMEAREAVVPETGKIQIVIFKPEGYQNLNYVDGQYDAEYQIRDMDEAGIDRAVLKLPGCQEWLPLDLCRVFNDGMAEHARLSGGRFHTLAVVPPFGTDENLKELERCVMELGMTGVQLSSHYGDRYLDDPAFRSFFRQLNDWNLPAYVHHTSLPVQFDSLLDYNNLRRSFGRCCDQITAVSREIFSGMFEELPRLKMVHSMLGGGFFSYMNLMFPKKSTKKEELDRFDSSVEPFQRALKENIYFEMSHAAPWGKIQMEAAVKIAGADHIIFGSSYPVRREWLTGGPDFIRNMDLSEGEKELLLSGNARSIYNIKES